MKKYMLTCIIVLGAASSLFAQKSESYIWQPEYGLCSQTYLLFADGTYNTESGCEASSHFAFGKWIQKKDTVYFTPADTKTFTVIKNITSRKTDSKYLTVKILDDKGQNITDRISMGQYIKNKGSYMLNPDSTKTLKTDYKRDGGVIILRSLQKLFNQKIEIPTDSSNYYEISLNISNDWIFHSSSDWSGKGNFKLLKTKEGLVTLLPDDKIIFLHKK